MLIAEGTYIVSGTEDYSWSVVNDINCNDGTSR